MKALTLTQPWASLVILGRKRVETRPVLFKHRGPLAIHASREVDEGAMRNDKILAALVDLPIDPAKTNWELPTGKVLGTVDVVDGARFVDAPFPFCLPFPWWDAIDELEQHFGNFATGRGGLLLANPRPFAQPIPARGMNGLWNWDESPLPLATP